VDELRLEGKWDRDEFMRARHRDYRVRLWDIFYFLAVVMLGWVLHEYVLELVIGIVFYIFAIYLIFPTRLWDKALGVSDQKVTIMNDEGITTTGPTYTVKEGWTAYSRSKETKEFYFLQRADRQVSSVFRKRSFMTPLDEAQFRAYLKAHTKAKLRENLSLDAEGA
jgi:hypothetical protein